MPYTYQELVDISESKYNTAGMYLNTVQTFLTKTYVHIQNSQYDAAVYDLYVSVNNLYGAVKYHHNYGNWGTKWHLCNELFFRAEPAGGEELTMTAILDAMQKAEPHQPLIFVALTEAYKSSVWNASFDENFFGDLVKKWSIWG